MGYFFATGEALASGVIAGEAFSLAMHQAHDFTQASSRIRASFFALWWSAYNQYYPEFYSHHTKAWINEQGFL